MVPTTITLPKLHKVIQGAMGWANCHFHQFEFGEKRYGELDPDGMDSALISHKNLKLATLNLEEAHEFIYLYDFGDDWQHRVVLESIRGGHPAWKRSICIAGERACPPEDVGGVPGYEQFLESIIDPDAHDHAESLEWVGGFFDPEGFDVNWANERIRKMKV